MIDPVVATGWTIKKITIPYEDGSVRLQYNGTDIDYFDAPNPEVADRFLAWTKAHPMTPAEYRKLRRVYFSTVLRAKKSPNWSPLDNVCFYLTDWSASQVLERLPEFDSIVDAILYETLTVPERPGL